MKALIQKVTSAHVEVDHEIVGQIERGLLVFLGVTHEDSEKDIDYLVNKIVNLRLFEGEKGAFDQSATDNQREILIVSQFTLYASCKKGRRPDFTAAAKPEIAEALYDRFAQKMRDTGLPVATGQFGAHMEVKLVNDGPVTLMIDSRS
jgi:D-tyrosyl-tRNA(Tyr) deacylase